MFPAMVSTSNHHTVDMYWWYSRRSNLRLLHVDDLNEILRYQVFRFIHFHKMIVHPAPFRGANWLLRITARSTCPKTSILLSLGHILDLIMRKSSTNSWLAGLADTLDPHFLLWETDLDDFMQAKPREMSSVPTSYPRRSRIGFGVLRFDHRILRLYSLLQNFDLPCLIVFRPTSLIHLQQIHAACSYCAACQHFVGLSLALLAPVDYFNLRDLHRPSDIYLPLHCTLGTSPF